MKWRPIAELTDRYAPNLLLRARELVDLDFNEMGVAPGHFQDGAQEGANDDGSFLAAKWCNGCETWHVVPVKPTHFCVLEGPELENTVRERVLETLSAVCDEHDGYPAELAELSDEAQAEDLIDKTDVANCDDALLDEDLLLDQVTERVREWRRLLAPKKEVTS